MTRGNPIAVAVALSLLVAGATAAAGASIKRDYIEPVGDLYTEIVAVEVNGMRTLYLSGQVWRAETLEEQSKGAYRRLKSLLEGAGASVDDVVKLTTYVVDWDREKADAAFAGFYEVFGASDHVPAHTLVGVKALYSDYAMLEVEAVAVVAADAVERTAPEQ